jgi:hypothetical protein
MTIAVVLPHAYVPKGLHVSPDAVELNASSIRKRTQIQQALKLGCLNVSQRN